MKSTANKIFGNVGEVENVLIMSFQEYVNDREKLNHHL
jgi:hypothetical protein